MLLKFFLALILAALLVFFGVELGILKGLLTLRPTYFNEIILFVALTTAIIFVKLFRTPKESFTQLYLLTIAVKILAYGVFAVIIILQDRSGAMANMTLFILTYFLFTAVEMGFLFKKISR